MASGASEVMNRFHLMRSASSESSSESHGREDAERVKKLLVS